jgi:hypothetical protein
MVQVQYRRMQTDTMECGCDEVALWKQSEMAERGGEVVVCTRNESVDLTLLLLPLVGLERLVVVQEQLLVTLVEEC